MFNIGNRLRKIVQGWKKRPKQGFMGLLESTQGSQ